MINTISLKEEKILERIRAAGPHSTIKIEKRASEVVSVTVETREDLYSVGDTQPTHREYLRARSSRASVE